jgi:hypothetical protein
MRKLNILTASMGLLCSAAAPAAAQATWNYIKTLSGPGNVDGAVPGVDQSWAQLKFKWSSPCPSPRSLTITARSNTADLAFKRFDDLGPVGEVQFLLPPQSATVTAVMVNGPCEARSEVEVFATTSSNVLPSGYPNQNHAGPSDKFNPTPAQTKQDAASAKARAKLEKQRKAKKPTQPSITQGCVTVYDIYSHALGWSFFRGPGLDAKIRNDCGRPAEIFLRIGYFDSRDGQFGYGIVSVTVASGAVYTVNHEMEPPTYREVLKTAKVLTLEAYQH